MMSNNQAELTRALNLYYSGRPAEAVQICQRVLESDRRNPDLWCFLGVVQRAAGDPEQAVLSYHEALRLRPGFPEAWNNLGNALIVLNRLDEAATAFQQVLRMKPDSPEAHNNLGALLRKRGQIREAAQHYQEALRLKPDYPDAHNNLGDAFASLERHEDAIICYRNALLLKPDYPEAHTNLGNSLVHLKQLEEGIAHHREALRLRPDYVEAHCNLGNALAAQKDHPAAEQCYRESIRLRPDYPEGHHNLGTALAELGRLPEAEAEYREALRLKPDYDDAVGNLATAVLHQGRPEEAAVVYDIILKRKPDDADTHMGKAFCYLLAGNLERGWREYEWRWRSKEFGSLPYTQPQWDGSPLGSRTILLHVEQGLGDTLFSVRYAAKVKERGGNVVMLCQKPLRKLLSRCQGIDQFIDKDDPLPAFDCHAPMMSLPGIFGTTLETVPAEVPYLFPDPDLVEQWRGEFPADGMLKIGLGWQGNPGFKGDKLRSIPLAKFAPLGEVPGVRWYSLQKGFGSEQLATAPFPVIDLASRLDEAAGPFMDTAAVLQHLDLLITCDSALAHLAGGLGVHTWLATGFAPHWISMLGREDSPWYPTMQLFRQRTWGDWEDIFRRMAEQLRGKR
jgi:tetratricopeptide (TPR) repeat protein